MNNIHTFRLKCKLTQTQLAMLLNIKQSTVAKWETSESLPRADKLPELARILGCSIDELFKGGEEFVQK